MDLLLQLLGCNTEAEAAAVIARYQNTFSALQATVGKQAGEEIVAAVRLDKDIASEIRELTGADTTAAILGVLQGWKASADRVTEIEAKAKAAEKAHEKADIKALLDERCPPAIRQKTEELIIKLSFKPEDVRTYLDSLELSGLPAATARTGVAQPRITQPREESSAVTLTADEKKLAKLLGHNEEWALKAKQEWARTANANSVAEFPDPPIQPVNQTNTRHARFILCHSDPSFRA